MPTVSPEDLPSIPEAEEGFSGSANLGVGRGLAMPGEPVTPAMYSEQEERPFFTNRKKNVSNKNMDYDELLELLINMADEMDNQEDSVLANFADFLIKKVAVQKSLNYSWLFRDLLIKIVDSDIHNQNEALINITRQFNKILKLHINLDNNMSEAMKEAYQGSMSRAKEYVK